MKSFLRPLSTLLLICTIASCGKKTEVKNGDRNDKEITPSTSELYFNALKEINRAVTENDLPALEKVVAENPGVDLNQILSDGETFLCIAIKKDFRDIRRFLIEKRASVEKANVNKETPLIAAVSTGKVNSVKVLLDLKVDMEKRNADGDTSLHIAIKKGFDEIALILLKQGANVEAVDRRDRNAMKLAQEFNVPMSFEFIKTLHQMEFGAPDVASFRNVLSQADVKRLRNILARYPKIVRDYDSINPLALLVDVKDENSAFTSAQLLLDHDANVNGPRDAEATPLIRATVNEKQSFARLYLEKNANPQLFDKEGKSALIHAVELNNLELVDLLLGHSAAEKYTFRKDGRKITYNACDTARKVELKLETPEEKAINKKIKNSLDCGFFRWLF